MEVQRLLQFTPEYSSQNYKIFEVSDDLLKDILNNPNQKFVIKGDAKRPAVLCTEEKTYSMTKVETSNTTLLLNENNLEGFVDCYYEVSPTIPADLDKIVSLVSKAYFPQEQTRRSSEKERRTEHYSTKDLLKCVQASEKEILSVLHYIDAFEVDGCWRVVEPAYAEEIFELITLCIIENDWKEQIPLDDCIRELPSHDARAVKRIVESLSSANEGNMYTIDYTKIAIIRAKSLFRTNPKWKRGDFESTWTNSVSSLPIQADLNLLYSYPMCIDEETSIRYIDRLQLSRDVKTRFKQIFQLKPKWKRQELEPFVQDLAKENFGVLLDQNCKVIQSVIEGSEPYYVSK